MNKLQGYTVGVLLMFTITFLGCKKDKNNPQCDCQTIYENLETVNTGGTVQLVWVLDYETTPISTNCSDATGFSYNGNSTTRWHTECQ